jgi:type II secretory pathway pseudopilin PulG
MAHKSESAQSGFALVEGLLIVVVIGLVAGIGVWVMNANKNVKKTANSSESASTSTVAKKTEEIKTVDAKMVGTAAAVETITKNDSIDESTTEDKEAAEEAANATNDLKVLNQAGDSFDEKTLF